MSQSSASAAASAASTSSSHPTPHHHHPPPLPSLHQQCGAYLWRADFDSANLERVEFLPSTTPLSTLAAPPSALSLVDTFHAYVSSDPHSTYRVWFHFSVSNGVIGRTLDITLKNLNNKLPLMTEGMRPIVRRASEKEWKRVEECSYRAYTIGQPTRSTLRRTASKEGDTTMTVDGDDWSEEEWDVPAESPTSSTVQSSPSSSPTAASTPSSTAAAAVSSSPPKPKPRRKIDDTMELTLRHTFDSEEEVFFAFCLPYSYTQVQAQMTEYEKLYTAVSPPASSSSASSPAPASSTSTSASSSSIYFHRELLIHSLEGRRVDLVTITSMKGKLDTLEPSLQHLYPPPTAASARNADFSAPFSALSISASNSAVVPPLTPEPRSSSFHSSKQIVFFSARVHPAESPSSYMCHGLIEFLLSSDARAVALRDHYVFKIVPMLNPDGVVHGYYRGDTLGENLNRHYESPSPEIHPAIYAVRRLILNYHERHLMYWYCDLHAHAVKRGFFLFGNHINDERAHIRNVAYAGLLRMNSPYFSLQSSNFTHANMISKEARDGLSKEGSGRVAFYRATQLTHCYTCETNYNSSNRTINPMAPLSKPSSSASSSASTAAPSDSSASSSQTASGVILNEHDLNSATPPSQYAATHFESMGRALAVSILDLAGLNEYTRLGATGSEYRDLKAVEAWAEQYIKSPPKKLAKRLAGKPASTPNKSPHK